MEHTVKKDTSVIDSEVALAADLFVKLLTSSNFDLLKQQRILERLSSMTIDEVVDLTKELEYQYVTKHTLYLDAEMEQKLQVLATEHEENDLLADKKLLKELQALEESLY